MVDQRQTDSIGLERKLVSRQLEILQSVVLLGSP